MSKKFTFFEKKCLSKIDDVTFLKVHATASENKSKIFIKCICLQRLLKQILGRCKRCHVNTTKLKLRLKRWVLLYVS